MISLNTQNRHQDRRLLQKMCIQLAWLPVLIRLLVVGVVGLAWFSICVTVLQRTAGLRYDSISFLNILGPQVLDFLNRINWYIWAGLLLIVTLFILGAIRSYLIKSILAGRNALVPLDLIETLATQLSPEALDVLKWVWKDKEVPINYGHIRTTLKQLRSGRVRKLALARAQKAAIDAALAASGIGPSASVEKSPSASRGQSTG